MSHHLLSAIPGSCKEVRTELEQICSLKLVGSNYKRLWDSLENTLGKEGAVEIALELAKIRGVRKQLGRRHSRSSVDLALMEPLSKITRKAHRYIKTRTTQSESKRVGKPLQATKRKRIISHDHITLPSIHYGNGVDRAKALAYQPIERLVNSRTVVVRARSEWLERNLETYLESHWTELDFGLGKEIELLGRQVRLSDSMERVDLLGRIGNVMIPIELKIKRAGGADLTQLQSYRKDLINRGESEDNVLGILVAPQFSHKVLNVVHGSSGVVLRWFEMPM